TTQGRVLLFVLRVVYAKKATSLITKPNNASKNPTVQISNALPIRPTPNAMHILHARKNVTEVFELALVSALLDASANLDTYTTLKIINV
ncbi:hypothetical protein, partial [Salmonella sp. s51228]|uniref:hypothetical protein n=1 Tax=Salmonella sp. s51228 TaxID=3159652 RepID=UPI00397F8426